VQKRVRFLEADLARRGCAAGDYRLTGTGVDHLCCTHLKRLSGNWRVIFGFAGDDEIAILAIGQHHVRSGRDVYANLYGTIGLDAPPRGRRTKPPCCDEEGEGEVDVSFFEELRGLIDRHRREASVHGCFSPRTAGAVVMTEASPVNLASGEEHEPQESSDSRSRSQRSPR
jgi:hypothetical protein